MFKYLTLCFITTFIWACQPDAPLNQSESTADSKTPFELYCDSIEKELPENSHDRKLHDRWKERYAMRSYPHGRMENHDVLNAQAYTEFMNNYSGDNYGNWQNVGPFDYIVGPQQKGPGMGRVDVIAFDPNSEALYAGTAAGGLWRKDNSTQNWFPLTDAFPMIKGVGGIALSPTASNGYPDQIYVLTGSANDNSSYCTGVFYSTDGGENWQNAGLQFDTDDFIRPHKLLAAPNNFQHQIALTSQGIYHTESAWQNYKQVQGGEFFDVEFVPGNTSQVYASTATGIWYSSDGGGNWQQSTATGLPQNPATARIELEVCPNEPEMLYALYAAKSPVGYYGLYVSTNSGTSFRQKSNSPNILGGSRSGNDTRAQIPFDLALTANPDNPAEIYVGGIDTWSSTDSGSTWDIRSYWVFKPTTIYNHADIHFLDFNDGLLYSGSDGGVYSKSEGDSMWTDLSAGLAVTMIYFLDGTPKDLNQIYYGAQDNGGDKLDASTGIKYQVHGGDGFHVAINPEQSDTVITSSQKGNFNISYDNYNSSTVKGRLTGSYSGQGAQAAPLEMNPLKPSTIIAGYSQMIRSYDSGNSWEPASINFGGNIKVMHYATEDSNYIYVVTANNRLWVTTTGGGTSQDDWTDITAGLPTDVAKISNVMDVANGGGVPFVCFSGYSDTSKVYASYDNFQTWTNLTFNLPNIPCNALVYVGDAIYVGMDVGIFSLIDAEQSDTWVPYSQYLPMAAVNDFYYHENTFTLDVGTYGRGVWRSQVYNAGN